MQLSPSRTGAVRVRLAAAACALVGVPSAPAQAAEATSSALLYSEPSRVTAFETRADFRTDLRNERVARASLTIDALTGASPNGALPSTMPQTFTRPSGASSYRIAAGETPLDPDFSDFRGAGTASLEIPLSPTTKTTIGAALSAETDYLSVGLNGRIARDFFRHNTTLTFGLSGSLDNVRAKGGTPTALASLTAAAERSGLRDEGEEEGEVAAGSELKRIGDVLVGLTQVIDPSTLMQLNYSVSFSSGYLTDPYKILSVVQGPDAASPGDPVDYVFEKRPDTRTKQALFWEGKHTFGRDVLGVSYRYLWDDWGIRSKTAEGRYLWELNDANGLEPQVRWYHQTAADFHTFGLVDGAALPDFATADYRLGEFDAWTTALKYTHRMPTGQELGIRVGYYRQTGDSHPPEAFGALRDLDLFPTVSAVMTQVSWSLRL